MNSGETVNSPSFPELDALLRLQDRLLHVSRLATVGETTSGIAHELNQPLCAVANYAQACDRMLSKPDPDIGEIRDTLHSITTQALRASEMIRRLRSLARTQEPQRQLADVNLLIKELMELIQSNAKPHAVRFRFEPDAGLPQVRVDCTQIQHVVLNLVTNSIEALSADPEELREILVRTSCTASGNVEISISDSGPGVPASISPHLFMPFCTSKPTGTGLGLAMSRSIAQAHSGKLEYRENVPHGACFTLTLPAVPTSAGRLAPEHDTASR